MNSLIEPDLAEEFAATFRLDSLDKIEADLIREQKLSGNSLYEAIYQKLVKVDDNIRFPDQAGGCFVKGTLVHTREGLKPIEEIKVGDYVLSSPEDGSGKPEYKRVLNTFVHKNKTVRYISSDDHYIERYGYYEGVDRPQVKVRIAPSFVATRNHPFWVERVGWTRADVLRDGDLLRLVDGGFTEIYKQLPVYRTDDAGVGWVQSHPYPSLYPAPGNIHDYENNRIPSHTYKEYDEDMIEENHLEVTVYNIEVEDFHTYYVGEIGVWVHNADCSGVGEGSSHRLG
ncbi:MAG: HINT domain-containing protein [Candidatus Accumulibacter sp.]|nr:HINT domain-containing protein [Accumulibacter sp.]